MAGMARPQPVVPGSAQTPAAASTVTMNVMPVLVTTSSIVMYRVVVAAYGDGAAYGSAWVGAPYWPGAPYGWAGVAQGMACWPFPEPLKRLKAGLLLGIVISSR